jgi:glycosyltransferase involved in cell wall biosynthesis
VSADWLICTGEYPPGCGGVGDYTAAVAKGLVASGDRVAVCTPRRIDGGRPDRSDPAVEIVELPDAFGRRSRRVIADRLAGHPSRLLVQYVPNAFGARGANLPWCLWLLHRARSHGDDVRVMFHEPYFYFDWMRPDRTALALVQRAMAGTLVRAATHVYASTASWERHLGAYATRAGVPLSVIPVPSSIPRSDPALDGGQVRARYLTRGTAALVGHFGTYGDHVATMLRTIVPRLLTAAPDVTLLCIGPGSERFAAGINDAHPGFGERLKGTGRLAAVDVAGAIAACHLMIQPFPDGATTRRTSLMAGLINGRPVLTTSGKLTEPIWSESRAVAMAPAGDCDTFVQMARSLLADPRERGALAARAEMTYKARFALEHTIGRLRLARAEDGTGAARQSGRGEAA